LKGSKSITRDGGWCCAFGSKVEGPSGHQVQNIKQKTEEKFEFVAERRGLYKFCFFNLGSIHETVDFDVHIGHVSSQEHLKDGM
jgi:protein ERP2